MPHFQIDLERSFFAFDDYSIAVNLESFVLQNLPETRQVSVLGRFQFSRYLQVTFLSKLD